MRVGVASLVAFTLLYVKDVALVFGRIRASTLHNSDTGILFATARVGSQFSSKQISWLNIFRVQSYLVSINSPHRLLVMGTQLTRTESKLTSG